MSDRCRWKNRARPPPVGESNTTAASGRIEHDRRQWENRARPPPVAGAGSARFREKQVEQAEAKQHADFERSTTGSARFRDKQVVQAEAKQHADFKRSTTGSEKGSLSQFIYIS